MEEIINYRQVEQKVLEIRGEKVILDSDVAELYGVETMRVNEAVKNNLDKFPEGYIIRLSKKEKQEVIEIFDNPKIKFSPTLPKAFTEKGLYMLATILKSPAATQTTIAIVETFAKLRELNSIIDHLPEIYDDEEQQKTLARRSGELVIDLFTGDTFDPIGDEISVELDLPLLKVKRTLKREKRKQSISGKE